MALEKNAGLFYFVFLLHFLDIILQKYQSLKTTPVADGHILIYFLVILLNFCMHLLPLSIFFVVHVPLTLKNNITLLHKEVHMRILGKLFLDG